MASTNFLQHNPGEANQENDATYAADSTRTGGIGTNQILPSVWLNKVWFQSSTFITAFANMMVTKGYTLLDSNLATLATVLANVLTLADFAIHLNATGHIKFPGGLTINWGTATNLSGGSETVTFDSAFTTALYAIVATGAQTGGTSIRDTIYITSSTLTTALVDSTGSAINAYWIAIGL